MLHSGWLVYWTLPSVYYSEKKHIFWEERLFTSTGEKNKFSSNIGL